YSERLHRRETIERVAKRYIERLRELIEESGREGASAYVATDFPLSGLGQEELEEGVRGRSDIEDIYGLSPMQEGMLFHSLYSPESGAYVIQMGVGIEGELDVGALERAWQGVVERHGVLRSRFEWEGLDEAVQVVEKGVRIEIEEEDKRGRTEEEQEEEVEREMREERERGFELNRAPLMRVRVVRRGEEKREVIWSYHHIVMDGWSVPIVLKEVFERYGAEVRGEEVREERRRPYREYIRWLKEQEKGRAEEYWREQMRGVREGTRLGVERVGGERWRGGEEEEGYGEEEGRISEEVSERLRGLSKREQVTMSTIVQGAWAVVMSRYSGEREVVYGAVVSGRGAGIEGMERMVGPLINTLPVRVEVREEEEVREWLRREQEKQAEMREYEYSSLIEVQGWSEVPRGQPLFESIVAYENYPVEMGERGGEEGVRVTSIRVEEQTNYPVTVVVGPG